MIGFIHPDQESLNYVDELKANATRDALSVSFLIGADTKTIAKKLSQSLIFWHLTGVLYTTYSIPT